MSKKQNPVPAVNPASLANMEKEKAEDAIFDMIENTEDPCKQWELAVWLVSRLPHDVIKQLSKRREDGFSAAAAE